MRLTVAVWVGGLRRERVATVKGRSPAQHEKQQCLTLLLSLVGGEGTSVLGILYFWEGNSGFPWNLGERSAKSGLSNIPVTKCTAPAAREGPAPDSSWWTCSSCKASIAVLYGEPVIFINADMRAFKIFQKIHFENFFKKIFDPMVLIVALAG